MVKVRVVDAVIFQVNRSVLVLLVVAYDRIFCGVVASTFKTTLGIHVHSQVHKHHQAIVAIGVVFELIKGKSGKQVFLVVLEKVRVFRDMNPFYRLSQYTMVYKTLS